VKSAADLSAWMDAMLSQVVARADGPAVRLAWHAFLQRDWDGVSRVGVEAIALRPSAVSRQATRALGARLVRTWYQLYPVPEFDEMLTRIDVDRAMALPAAFGVVCAASGVDVRDAVQAFIYTRLASAASAAMRLMPIGQGEAHRLLASKLESAAPIAEAIVAHSATVSCFAPGIDIASMSHQYVHSRLFRS
jgi:urease accessory protein